MAKNLLITGGAGFMGSNFVRYFSKKHAASNIVVIDKFTYAGNPKNLENLREKINIVKGDICDKILVKKLLCNYKFDAIINFAAETHVDRSLYNEEIFRKTNVEGTKNLLEKSLDAGIEKFIHISTDEVYGSIKEGSFTENSDLNPTSPYSKSKAEADELILNFYEKHKQPKIYIIRPTNNFGPYQYPEKLIPFFITQLLVGEKVLVYGDGKHVRDWLYVFDDCEAIDFILEKGKEGEIYNVAGKNEKENLFITKFILHYLQFSEKRILHVKDRPRHDRRYSIDDSKIRELGWKPRHNFEDSLIKTINWYLKNKSWWKEIRAKKEFQKWYKINYIERK